MVEQRIKFRLSDSGVYTQHQLLPEAQSACVRSSTGDAHIFPLCSVQVLAAFYLNKSIHLLLFGNNLLK